MKKDVIDLQKVLKKNHEGKWMALTEDYAKVIDFSKDLQTLKEKVGIEDVVYIKVPTFGRSYAFIEN